MQKHPRFYVRFVKIVEQASSHIRRWSEKSWGLFWHFWNLLCSGQERFGRWWHGVTFRLCSNKSSYAIFSLIVALVLSISCYIVENQPFPFLEKTVLYYFLEAPFKPEATTLNDSACFINVSHDRQLVNIDISDTSAGNTDITDRAKLLTFLQRVDTINYKYILLDIRFDNKYKTAVDSQLFQQIVHMRDIVIANHTEGVWDDYHLADTSLLKKAGMSDYKYRGLSSSFSHYSFLQDKKPSMALKMYDRTNPTSIKQVGNMPLYISEGHLCTNCPMLPIKGNVYSIMNSMNKYDGDGDSEDGMNALMLTNYYEDLGPNFLSIDGRDWAADLNGKYIIIGDMENDIHYTYRGTVPGAYIIWMAFLYLQNGRHILSWTFIMLMFCYYALTVFFLFHLNTIENRPEHKNDLRFRKFIALVSWVGSFGILYLVTFIAYKNFSIRYNVTIPIIFITLINFIINNAKDKHHSHSDNVSAL